MKPFLLKEKAKRFMTSVLVVGLYYTIMARRIGNFNMPMSKIKIIKVIKNIDDIDVIKVIKSSSNTLRKPLIVAILKKLFFKNKAFLGFFHNPLF